MDHHGWQCEHTEPSCDELRWRAVSPDGRVTITAERSHEAYGSTATLVRIEHQGCTPVSIGSAMFGARHEPHLPAVAFSADLALMIERREQQRAVALDARSGAHVTLSADHAVADELLLSDLFPSLVSSSVAIAQSPAQQAVSQFMRRVVAARRHMLTAELSDDERCALCLALLERCASTDEYQRRKLTEGLLLLVDQWQGPRADEVFATVRDTLGSWPQPRRRPSWLSLLRPSRVWSLLTELSIDASLSLLELHTLTSLEDLPPLRRLRLHGRPVGAQGATLLAGWPRLSPVTELSLDSMNIGERGARALAESSHTRRLVRLELSGNHIGDQGAVAIAQASHFDSLEVLSLHHNEIGDEGAIALAASEPLRNSLRELHLGENRIGPRGQRALRNGGYRDGGARSGNRTVYLHDQRA